MQAKNLNNHQQYPLGESNIDHPVLLYKATKSNYFRRMLQAIGYFTPKRSALMIYKWL